MEEKSLLSNIKIDYHLLFILFLLFSVSCVAIFSAQQLGQYESNFLMKQIIFYVIGLFIIGVILLFDLDQLKRLTWYLYGFGNLLLVVLIFAPSSLAPTINGAKSWYVLPGIGSFQPSELMKIFLIITLGHLITTHHEKYLDKTLKSDFILMAKLFVVTLLPLMLVMEQPDLGSSLVIIAIFAGLLFVSGVSWKIIATIFTIVSVIVATIFYFILFNPDVLTTYIGVKEYQLGRIYSWLNPENYQSAEGYQLSKSLLAIGTGTLLGKAFTKGFTQSEVYLPEGHTDFIFSVIGEEFGFVGSSIVISLFFLLIYRMIKIALETDNPFGSYICAGIIAMTTFHVFQNIGMTIGVLPITGIPLPFISYGGSSLMANMFAIGLVLSVNMRIKQYMFSTKD